MFLLSLFISGLLLIWVNHYYPETPSQIIAKSGMDESIGVDLASFSFAVLIEYFAILFIVYIFLRGVLKTFEKHFSGR